MRKPWKFLLSLVLTAFFAVLFMPYCFLGLFGARFVGLILDELFSQFGSTTPVWVGMTILLPMAFGWVASPIALLALAFIGIWRKPKSSHLTEGKS